MKTATFLTLIFFAMGAASQDVAPVADQHHDSRTEPALLLLTRLGVDSLSIFNGPLLSQRHFQGMSMCPTPASTRCRASKRDSFHQLLDSEDDETV